MFFFSVKPRFHSKYLKSYTVVEGESLNITLNATGNPPQIKYKWSYPSMVNKAKIHTDRYQLTLTNAQRHVLHVHFYTSGLKNLKMFYH